jgi:hypothetical protein
MRTLHNIESAVKWYAMLSADYNDINTLMNARRRLACHLFNFAIEIGELNREKNRTEHVRKSKYAMLVHDALVKSEGKNVASNQLIIDYKVSFERGEEGAAESTYYAGKLIYDAGTNVLDTMNQHISNLKKERSLEYSHQGSQ